METEVAGLAETPASEQRRRLPVAALVALGVVALAVVLLLGSFVVRRAGYDGRTLCKVTDESLGYRLNVYDGGDHPRDSRVGDLYYPDSGCNAFEDFCVRRVSLFGSRADC